MSVNFFHFRDRWTLFSNVWQIQFRKASLFCLIVPLWDPTLLQYALNFYRNERDFFSHHSSGNRSVISPIYILEPY